MFHGFQWHCSVGFTRVNGRNLIANKRRTFQILLTTPRSLPRSGLNSKNSRGPAACSSSTQGWWKDFREIAAWQRAEQLKLRVTHSSIDQRCGGRFGNKEFAKFARIAKASQLEVFNHFIDARDLRLLTNDQFLIEEHYVKIALKTTVGLIRHLESSRDPPRPVKRPSPPRVQVGRVQIGGKSTVPAAVQGPHRTIRFIAIAPPRTIPKRAITASP